MFASNSKRILLFVAALAILAAGCASTKINSRISPDWSEPIDGAMIVVHVAGNWSGYDSTYLAERIQDDLEARGIPSDLLATDPLSLETPDINTEIAGCGFDHVLYLSQTTEKTMSQGWLGDSPRGFVFDVRLIRVADAEIMWRGNLDASGNADSRRTYINSMVKTLMERLEADRVVPRTLEDFEKPEEAPRQDPGTTPR